MKSRIKLVILLTAVLWVGSMLGRELSRQHALRECVQQTDGSDLECDSCYKAIYGTYPTH